MSDEVLNIPPATPYFPYDYSLADKAWRSFQIGGIESGLSGVARTVRRVEVARALALRLNSRGGASSRRPARAGELLAMGLLSEVLRHMAVRYCTHANPGAMQRALDAATAHEGPDTTAKTLPAFVKLYPHDAIRTKAEALQRYLNAATLGRSNKEIAAQELLLLHITELNPALLPYAALYSDEELYKSTPARRLLAALERFFVSEPEYPGAGMNLYDLLRAPAKASPDSLEGQIAFIQEEWGAFLPEELLQQLTLTADIIKEETTWRGHGPGESQVVEFGLGGADYPEPEAFSVDKHWMPNLVLLAKTTYVWLDQLSKLYGQRITRLDEIPDEELDRLSAWGFSGLWLIGLWERSEASRKIKQMTGNPEAAASAYSLYDYQIAHDLGGEVAYRDLAARAWKRGIRLASDMVPNHVGLYSRWVIEHPDWFVQSPTPPFPSYTFNGANLSDADGVGLYIEDGYWEQRDAAVVFKRVDFNSGATTYIYHGNDGTNMPWNDTAQLNFLIPEVREAVIQAVLHVARHFPVIRFDAAMTLAKKHFQRLWYPKPGDAGAIPSRAEHGMSREAFDEVFPAEFWREVVDRVAVEAPDTLLLAEAFWLMEGYFVRTLGMHRVYNSAFMNMLKLEENQKYRQTLKNVLEFSPAVLQRFVNFMNNPDEETAEAQFGKGDKYFGVCMMMATMPGLPMFGHGQVEGYTEKYGMEYRRAYRDEWPDEWLVSRHETEVFPVMRQRHVFSGAEHYRLFDFNRDDGGVDENVFAYSNRSGDARGLVVFNNAYHNTSGTIHYASAYNVGNAEDVSLQEQSLAEALALNVEATTYYIVHDAHTNLDYLHHVDEFKNGLHVELSGYGYRVLVNWREIHDFDNSWGKLHGYLAGRGAPSMDDAYCEMLLEPLLKPFRKFVNARHLRILAKEELDPTEETSLATAFTGFAEALAAKLDADVDVEQLYTAIQEDVDTVRQGETVLEELLGTDEDLAPLREFLLVDLPKPVSAGETKEDAQRAHLAYWRVPLAWSLIRKIGEAAAPERAKRNGFDAEATSGAWMREWFLTKQVQGAFRDLDQDDWRAGIDAAVVRACVAYGGALLRLHESLWAPVLQDILNDPDVIHALRLSRYRGRRYIRQEQFEYLLRMMMLTQVLAQAEERGETEELLLAGYESVSALRDAATDVGYDLDAIIAVVK